MMRTTAAAAAAASSAISVCAQQASLRGLPALKEQRTIRALAIDYPAHRCSSYPREEEAHRTTRRRTG